jgi:hypothetical protein
MEKLNPQQIAGLYNHLLQTGINPPLADELLDHLACEVEFFMWIGLPFESALAKTLIDADAGAVRQLGKNYQLELALSETQLQQASLDDIIFQFRNKDYGAYALRQAYPATLRNAMVITLGLCMMLMALMQLLSRGTFSYWSTWGAIWLTGLGAVIFTGLNWYLQHERQNELFIR